MTDHDSDLAAAAYSATHGTTRPKAMAYDDLAAPRRHQRLRGSWRVNALGSAVESGARPSIRLAGAHGSDGCGSGGPWKSTVEAVVTVPRWACPCRASGESGRERAVASVVAHSEVVMATGAAVMMGPVIAATAA
eukprot:scaffold51483_cov32-Phaeocystis_antarctica.AAC.1